MKAMCTAGDAAKGREGNQWGRGGETPKKKPENSQTEHTVQTADTAKVRMRRETDHEEPRNGTTAGGAGQPRGQASRPPTQGRTGASQRPALARECAPDKRKGKLSGQKGGPKPRTDASLSPGRANGLKRDPATAKKGADQSGQATKGSAKRDKRNTPGQPAGKDAAGLWGEAGVDERAGRAGRAKRQPHRMGETQPGKRKKAMLGVEPRNNRRTRSYPEEQVTTDPKTASAAKKRQHGRDEKQGTASDELPPGAHAGGGTAKRLNNAQAKCDPGLEWAVPKRKETPSGPRRALVGGRGATPPGCKKRAPLRAPKVWPMSDKQRDPQVQDAGKTGD